MTYDGDITLMTGITNLRNEDFYYSPIFSQKMNISQKELGTFTYYQNDQAKEGKLYLIGDSFNDLLKDYLVRYFHETYKIHKDDEANYAFDIKTGDTIVFETVERYIDTLDDSIINFNMGGA